MNNSLNVLVAIQARSTSTRFPRKIYQKIGEKRMLDHVIDAGLSTVAHISKYAKKQVEINCSVAVLVPENDDIVHNFSRHGVEFYTGPEHDVLTRYVNAQRMSGCDYMVRLTSDCPLMLDFIVSKCINAACFNGLDYVQNVDEDCRSVADGFDCEVFSTKALKWLDENAKSEPDREHVTHLLRKINPVGIIQGFVPMKLDTAHLKLSVDTPYDLEIVRSYYELRHSKRETARRKYGKHVYEL